jgi:hypothetical protein
MKTRIVQFNDHERIVFYCEGCKTHEAVPISGPRAWGWNGDLERPTLTPSILSTTPHPDGNRVCHSFVTDGKIQYLGDCSHALAGQTIDLPDLEF